MQRIPAFRQQSLHTLERRLGARVRRWLLRRFVPTPTVNLVRFGGRPYKRITFIDAWRAEGLARVLDEYRDAGIFPQLVARFENELMVEYIEGEHPDAFDAATIAGLARFFGALYGAGARRLPTAQTRFGAALERDLFFLRDCGVLREPLRNELASKLPAILPSELWVGTEYIDSLPKNFVRAADDRLVAIDVDAIHRDELIGIGVAKAFLDASGGERDLFFRELDEHVSLDLAPLMPFVDLSFLASWTKLLFLKGRARRIEPARFEAWLSSGKLD